MGLEMSAHSWGLCETNWGNHWLQARKECQQDAENDGYLMTTIGPDGTFTPGCKMETDEIAIHLREILIDWGISPDEASKYTSHSMKATLLSWIAKAGGPMKARRMLGYHSKGTDKSTLVYRGTSWHGRFATLVRLCV